MPVGVCGYAMSSQQQKWIRGASEVLIDLFRTDVLNLKEGESLDETSMYQYLPERYQHRYDLSFAQQFLDVMILVAWKIRDKGWWMLNSVAEELAMRAILHQAEVQAELEGKSFASEDLVDYIFEDTDIEFLFLPKFDGIEDDEYLVRHMGIANLHFGDWFNPFRPTGIVV